jgi:Tol biopolymer transport system component
VQHPAWSPDNQWIAFTMQVGTLSRDYRNQFPYSLYIAHPDGTDRHLVVQDSEKAYMGCNQWSSGGNLAYVLIPIPPTITNPITRAGDLFIYQPTAETPTLALKDIPCPFNLSPDGRFITFVRDNRLMILSFETQAATTLSEQTVSENNIVGWTLE